MDNEEFRERGRQMIDYIAKYMETVAERRVTADVEPGYLKKLIPDHAPEKGQDWDSIMSDVETKIMPGVTHWQHPRFHAYFPSGNSFPSILGDMLSDGIGCIGFSWASSPVCTELETIVLDWFGKMLGLPDEFLSSTDKGGGGVMQSSASECILVSLLAARAQKIGELKLAHPFIEEAVLLSKLVGYTSREAHSCVEKASMIALTKLRILEPDEDLSLRGATLLQAIHDDQAAGLVPFFVSATLGTTSCASFDNLAEIGPVCEQAGVWLHVDAAYAGNSFICPEFKYLLNGIQYAMSFNTNPNKWLLTNFDCSTMWTRDRVKLTQAMIVDPLYLQHNNSDKSIDYRHWGIPLSRRFRALKLWFVIRNYGVEGLQNYIREHCRLAKCFERLVMQDDRFQVCNIVRTGLVCFRLKGPDELSEKLLANINRSGELHMIPSSAHGRYLIRFCVCAPEAKEDDINFAWQVISDIATDVLADQNRAPPTSSDQQLLAIAEQEEEVDESELDFALRVIAREVAAQLVDQQSEVLDELPPRRPSVQLVDDLTGLPPRRPSAQLTDDLSCLMPRRPSAPLVEDLSGLPARRPSVQLADEPAQQTQAKFTKRLSKKFSFTDSMVYGVDLNDLINKV